MKARLNTWLGWFFAALLAAALTCSLSTQLASNAMMLLLDGSNAIPAESSIFFFEPYVINQGSSNYWLYGRDRRNYYHFIHRPDAAYVYIPIHNSCPGFDDTNARTWCEVRTGGGR